MPKQSHEIAQESRDNEAEILGGRSRRAVINGREYTFLQPSRRDNRIMFAEVVKIQQIAQRTENRVRVLMEMFQFLIDWHPMIAADEIAIEDAMRAELSTGSAKTSTEIAQAYKEIALLVSAPFRPAASTQKTEKDT